MNLYAKKYQTSKPNLQEKYIGLKKITRHDKAILSAKKICRKHCHRVLQDAHWIPDSLLEKLSRVFYFLGSIAHPWGHYFAARNETGEERRILEASVVENRKSRVPWKSLGKSYVPRASYGHHQQRAKNSSLKLPPKRVPKGLGWRGGERPKSGKPAP